MAEGSEAYGDRHLQLSETKTVILIIDFTSCKIVINLNITTDLQKLFD